jgi:hypothetical protein
MNHPKHYKQYIKQVTDLFWTPNEGAGVHLTFDGQYHVSARRAFDTSEPQNVVHRAFDRGRDLPVPVFGSVRGEPDSEGSETSDAPDLQKPMRCFLSFPSGFCAEINRAETKLCVSVSWQPLW